MPPRLALRARLAAALVAAGAIGLAGCPHPADTPTPAHRGGRQAVPKPEPAFTGPQAAPVRQAPTDRWEPLVDGLAWRRWELGGEAPAALLAVQADPALLAIEVVPLHTRAPGERTAAELVANGAALAAVNGGFFVLDKQGAKQPLGLLMHAGKRSSDLRRADWGIFLIAQGKPRIIHCRDPLPAGTTEALQCGPRLLIDGRSPSFKAAAATRRSAIGMDDSGRVVLAATESGALTLPQLAGALRSLGCRWALNLDGGPSTQLSLRAGDVQTDIPGLWAVPSAIRVRTRR